MTHNIIVTASFAVLFWHVLCAENLIALVVVGVSGAFLIIGLAHKAWRRAFPEYSAVIHDIQRHPQSRIVTITASLVPPVRLMPGGYFRVSFHKAISLRRYSIIAFSSPLRDDTDTGVRKTIKFVLSTEGSWEKNIHRLTKNGRLTFDGPYGQDLRLRTYETVFFAAKGMGIVGVLPLALDLAERKYRDASIQTELTHLWTEYRQLASIPTPTNSQKRKILRENLSELEDKRLLDATRKVVVLWLPETNAQMEPLASELARLKSLDPLNVRCKHIGPLSSAYFQ